MCKMSFFYLFLLNHRKSTVSKALTITLDKLFPKVFEMLKSRLKKPFLEQLYLKEGLSERQIGKRLRIQDRRSVEKFAKLIGFIIKRKQDILIECVKGYKLYVTPHKESKKLRPRVLELRGEGYSFSEIAEKTGLSIGTVWRHLHTNK